MARMISQEYHSVPVMAAAAARLASMPNTSSVIGQHPLHNRYDIVHFDGRHATAHRPPRRQVFAPRAAPTRCDDVVAASAGRWTVDSRVAGPIEAHRRRAEGGAKVHRAVIGADRQPGTIEDTD